MGNFKGSRSRKLFKDLGFYLFLEGFHRFVSLDFGRLIDGGFDPGTGDAVGDFEELVLHQKQGSLAFLFTGSRGEFFLDLDDGLDCLLGEFEGSFEISLRKFFGAAFDHEGFVFGSDIDEIEVAFGVFVMGRVGDKLSIHSGDANGTDGSGPWDIGDHEGGGGAVHRKNIRIVLPVGTEKDGNDLCIVEIPLGEQRAERAVDHPAGENFFFRRAAFAAKIASGNPTHGGSLFLVFDGEGKEILAVLDLGGGDGGYDNDRFSHGDEGGPVCKFGKLAGFDVNFAIAHAGGKFFMGLAHGD